MISTVQESVQRLVLYSVPWSTYDTLLHAFEGRHLRISYDRGSLEIMTLSLEYEFFKKLLGRFIEMLTFELQIAIKSGGSTTLREALAEKGLEPDESYWIGNEPLMRGKLKFDIDADPPPDLAVEVDISSSSINRMGIYAAMGVREIWRFDGEALTVHHLGANGKYQEKEKSRAFPYLPVQEILRFLREGETMDENSLLRSFQQWVRDTITPIQNTKKNKPTNGGKKNGK